MPLVKNSFVNKKLVEKAKKEKVELVFDRFEKQQPLCLWGLDGGCCKNCFQGPCRIIPSKGALKGVCGAAAAVKTGEKIKWRMNNGMDNGEWY